MHWRKDSASQQTLRPSLQKKHSPQKLKKLLRVMNWYNFKQKVLSHLFSGYSTVLLMDVYCESYILGQSALEHSN